MEKKPQGPKRRPPQKQQVPEPRIERKEGTNKVEAETAKYHRAVNKEGVTQATKNQQAAEVAGKDCGESSSTKSVEDAKKADPSLMARIKRMVKEW